MMADRPGILRDLADGSVLPGVFVNLGSALAAEACAMAGCRWLVLDLEHGSGTETELLSQLLAAAAHDVPAFVRAESTDRIRSGRVLDLGAQGVMFPRIENAEQAAAAVAHLRYQPEGDRGVATYNRSCSFGLDPDALRRAASETVGIIQIETVSALAEAAEIAGVRGVDVLFVGPRDLSHAMGIPGQFDHPRFREALDTVVAAARKHHIVAGILAGSAESAAAFVRDGFQLVGVGSDSSLLAAAVRNAVRIQATEVAQRR